jgi:hypothetical protein
MRQAILVYLIIVPALFAPGQTTVIAGKLAGKFFKSSEDYLAGKSIDGAELNTWKEYASSVEMTENGVKQKVKISKLPYLWFCNSEGMLMRVFDGDLYYAVVTGPLSFYIKTSEGTVFLSGGNYTLTGKFSDSWPNEYYSLGPDGAIEKLKGKVLEDYLEKYGMKSQYDKDPQFKREAKDCVLCWQEKKTNKMIKYVKLLNEKMK